MKINITSNIDVQSILQKRGLGSSNDARKVIASEVARLADPYVPMSAGAGAHMKNQVQIAPDGSSVTYSGPYAHYQYRGEVMAGKAPKHYTGKAISYHDALMRGKEWDKRMLADKSDELADAAAAAVGGKRK